MFGSRISLTTLSHFCRSLASMLHSGVVVHKAVATAGNKMGDITARRAFKDVSLSLQKGDDLTQAFERHGKYFPELFCDMLHIAEETGTLPEVLESLADHYENLVQLRRNFLGAIALPMLQLIAAVFIIAAVMFILGIIAESQGGEATDVLGWGMTGASGAIRFLTYVGLSVATVFILYLLFTRSLQATRALHTALLRVPVVGGCMRSFAIARFSWAYYLTQHAGMDIRPSLESSFRATANAAFVGVTPQVVGMVMAGEDLTHALRETRLFPEEYLQIVEVGETSGTVPEQLHRLSPQFQDQARRSLAMLAGAFSMLVWALVAGFIIMVIFSLFSFYLGQLNEAMKPI